MNATTQPSVADLKRDLHLIASADPGESPDDPRLVEDLGLDSLAMAEVMVLLEEKYGMTGQRVSLLTRDWRGITVSQIYEESCRTNSGTHPAG
ncbi:MAG TPA: acyl carrier protein [Solirubrobacterales bacterium]|nr:acyl carrier protein [Solirubrobacterales bacterium]